MQYTLQTTTATKYKWNLICKNFWIWIFYFLRVMISITFTNKIDAFLKYSYKSLCTLFFCNCNCSMCISGCNLIYKILYLQPNSIKVLLVAYISNYNATKQWEFYIQLTLQVIMKPNASGNLSYKSVQILIFYFLRVMRSSTYINNQVTFCKW